METHVHLPGTAPYSFLLSKAKDVDGCCRQTNLPPGAFLPASLLSLRTRRILQRLVPVNSDWFFLNNFVALTNHSQLQTSLCEFNNRGLQVNPNESYADFERFDLTFEIQDAFLDRGGKSYLVALLKHNSAILEDDNVSCVEYSFGIKPDAAEDLIAAVQEVEALYSKTKIRFLASFRGVDKGKGEEKLLRLLWALIFHPKLRQYVVGLDVMGNEVARNWMPFKLLPFRFLAMYWDLGVRIHLGEAINDTIPHPWDTIFDGLDAACLALADQRQVRLGHGVYIKQLVEYLQRGSVEVPPGMQSSLFRGSVPMVVAGRILEMLRDPNMTIEVCLNSNLALMAGPVEQRKDLLHSFLCWLKQEKVNFCFGTDDPGIHGEMQFLAVTGPLCHPSHFNLRFPRNYAAWYCEYAALHVWPECSDEDMLRARARSVSAAFDQRRVDIPLQMYLVGTASVLLLCVRCLAKMCLRYLLRCVGSICGAS